MKTEELLRDEGIITICGEVGTENMSSAVNRIVYMNSLNKPEYKAIQLILNSPGGNLRNCFMLADFIEYSKLPVYITGVGICASAGILLLCSGHKGKRTVTKNTSLLSHQYSWSSAGKYGDLVADRKQQNILQQRMINHYRRHTGMKVADIEKYLMPDRDVWLTPKEAIKFKLIDKVIN